MPVNAAEVNHLLSKHQKDFSQVIKFNPERDSFIRFDFTANNRDLNPLLVGNTAQFSAYINTQLAENNAFFGIGGYFEHRTLYTRSSIFDTTEAEPRRLHLGVDIWMAANTPVYAFMNAKVHSFAFNNQFGDYGATIILSHKIGQTTFFSLYGHLSLKSIQNLKEGDTIKAGQNFAWLGEPEENGNWPSHLHFQLITDIGDFYGDYPGVCRFSEKGHYQQLIPNPHFILGF